MLLVLMALSATAMALLGGLFNFWRGGRAETSAFWMGARLICQGVALALLALLFYRGV